MAESSTAAMMLRAGWGQMRSSVELKMLIFNKDVASKLGVRLKQSRESQSKTLENVAGIINLSRSQVKCIEIATLDSFYNVRFYAQAARKYCDLMGIDYPHNITRDKPTVKLDAGGETLARTVFKAIKNSNERIAKRHASLESVTHLSGESFHIAKTIFQNVKGQFSHFRKQKIYIGVVMSIGLVLVFSIFDRSPPASYPRDSMAVNSQGALEEAFDAAELKPNIPEKSANNLAMQVDAIHKYEEPLASPIKREAKNKATPTLKPLEIEISFVKNTWCQIVYRNGDTKLVHYARGDVITLDKSNLQAIVIGGLNTAQVRNSTGGISLSRFFDTKKSQVRIIGVDARSL